jgi:hypothetical protein
LVKAAKGKGKGAGLTLANPKPRTAMENPAVLAGGGLLFPDPSH